MVLFPNCKINLGLRILDKRPDGYHNLETIFYPIPLKDALETVVAVRADQEFDLQIHGLGIEGPAEKNLVFKAWQLLKKDYPSIPPLRVTLLKKIPVGAGLGGGSSDGAFMLTLLNKLLDLCLSDAQLRTYALQLGSDCPFFLINQPAYATGRGEQLQPVDIDLSRFRIVVVFPNIHISTAWAFSRIVPEKSNDNFLDVTRLPVEQWREKLVNDFEEAVFEAHPPIGDLKTLFYDEGALYASMSGSGSSVFGIFSEKPVNLEKALSGYQFAVV